MDPNNWSSIRDYIIEITGEAPSAELEDELIQIFQRHPAEVAQAAVQICGRYQQGTVRSVWAVLRKHAHDRIKNRSASITAYPDREKKIGQAKQEIRATIATLDRWSEVENILYGHNGRLQPWAHDNQLRHEMEMFWVEQRPIGEQIEREALERAEAWRRSHKLRKEQRDG